MFDLGGGELLLILVAVLILFGPKKLPELAQGLGKGLRQFRQAQREFTEQINTAFEDEQRKSAASRARPGAVNTISRSSVGGNGGRATEETEERGPATAGKSGEAENQGSEDAGTRQGGHGLENGKAEKREEE